MSQKKVSITCYSVKNTRSYQEDRVINIKDENFHIFGVLDGHGGSACSSFCSNYIKEHTENFKGDLVKAVNQMKDAWDTKCMKQLQIEKFPDTKEERDRIFSKPEIKDGYRKNGLDSGTTLNLVVFKQDELSFKIVNIGDSRTIWRIDEQKTIHMTKDHTPHAEFMGNIDGEIKKEKEDSKRVNGVLAVGKAIGDNTEDLMGTITAHPDIYEIQLKKQQTITMIVGTDGLYEDGRANKKEKLEILLMELAKHKEKKKADNLVRFARDEAFSSDNISCVLFRYV